MSINLYKSWIEINSFDLNYNLSQVKEYIGDKVNILGIVKANAYGHGLKEVSEILRNEVDWFGVDNIDEALEIRSLGIKKPILILGFVPFSRLMQIGENDISISVYNKEFFSQIMDLKINKPFRIHLKIETGLNRQGVLFKNLVFFINQLKTFKDKIVVEGVYTHFSDTHDVEFVNSQFVIFQKAIEILEKNGFSNLLRHSSASAGILIDRKYHLDMVRIGISLYGYLPYSKPKSEVANLELVPVLGWKSVVGQVKWIEAGQFVGYGRTWQSKTKTKIAIIPVGYCDGFDRRFSNKGKVLVGGKIVNVIGRVAMNMFMIDVTKVLDVKVGDEVVLIGKQGNKKLTADDLANQIGTIDHEILSRINPQILRVVV